MKSLLSLEENKETIEGTVNSLIMRLIGRMICITRGNGMEMSLDGGDFIFLNTSYQTCRIFIQGLCHGMSQVLPQENSPKLCIA